jgi:hypothetical protein
MAGRMHRETREFVTATSLINDVCFALAGEGAVIRVAATSAPGRMGLFGLICPAGVKLTSFVPELRAMLDASRWRADTSSGQLVWWFEGETSSLHSS